MIIRSKCPHHIIRICLNILITGVVAALFVGCNSSDESHNLSMPQPADDTEAVTVTESHDSYPIPSEPSAIVQVDSYPYPVPTLLSQENLAYPDPANSTIATGTLLALNKPVTLNDVIVTGVGPPGLQVYILNITLMGEPLGSGVIEQDGTFTIAISEVSAGARIGLIADVSTISLGDGDVQPGENAVLVPQVGYFYDSYVIRE